MDEYRTVLEVRFSEPHREEGTWDRYDETLIPYGSDVRCTGEWDEDSMVPHTPDECAEYDLEYALGPVIDEQYLARVVRQGPMDVRVRLLERRTGLASWRHVSTHTPDPAAVARAYLRSAVEGFDDVRRDLRYRICDAYRAGDTADSLVSSVAGRIPEDEVLGLLRAHDEAEKATGLIAQLVHDLAHEAEVGISDRNELELRLYPSFAQEINFQEWGHHGDEGDWGPDPWGHQEGVEAAERLLTVLAPHYAAFRDGQKATADHLAPSQPPFPGVVRISPLKALPSPAAA
ncbi:hypothetical protein [Streptomyces sp. NPDC091416]|uniref:hypothetical protein n=1 Tax=Streptomyces sp. NPDC091416 TaxID=3366003 RepID=UPI00381AB0D5